MTSTAQGARATGAVPRLVALGATLCVATAGPAFAQLQQPRCGGWPPAAAGPGQYGPGFVVGAAGVTCYGQVLNRIGPDWELVQVRVKRPPAQGRLVMVGTRDFAYTPNAGMRGRDGFSFEVVWMNRGKRVVGGRVFRAMIDTEYANAGGTATRPPSDFSFARRRRP